MHYTNHVPIPLTLLKRSHPHSYLTNAGKQVAEDNKWPVYGIWSETERPEIKPLGLTPKSTICTPKKTEPPNNPPNHGIVV